MLRQLNIQINCGNTTCASKPGEFCKYMGSRHFGSVPICTLFPSEDAIYTELQDKGGWVQRCQDCLDSE